MPRLVKCNHGTISVKSDRTTGIEFLGPYILCLIRRSPNELYYGFAGGIPVIVSMRVSYIFFSDFIDGMCTHVCTLSHRT